MTKTGAYGTDPTHPDTDADGDAVPDHVDPAEDKEQAYQGGCGCMSARSTAPVLGLLFALLAVRRRR